MVLSSHRAKMVFLGAVVTAAGLLAGCSKKITITRYPEFYKDNMKGMAVAVVPFRNETKDRNAGNAVSDMLARAIAANGTYRVYSQNDLGALEDQRDLMIYAQGGNAAALASKFRKVPNLKAIIVGTVTTYVGTRNQRTEYVPIYQYRNGQQYLVGQRPVQITRNEANVVVSAAMIRVSDGETIWSVVGVQGRDWAEGASPARNMYACLANAAQSAVNQLVTQFAVTRMQIKVNPGKDFRTASELYDGKWEYEKKFKVTDEQMFVVLSLPPVCDRNPFRITIVRKDQRKDLAEQKFLWDKKYGGYGYPFSPKAIAEAGGGPGDYTAKFYSGPEPVMTCDFKIDD